MEEKVTPEQLEQIKEAENDYIVNRFIMVHMCMCYCSNLMQDIIDMVKKQGRYRFGLKNTLKNVRREIKEMMGDFFGKIDVDCTAEYVSNYEVFENTLNVLARLKDFDESKLSKPREIQFTEWWYQEHRTPPTVADIIDWADRN